MSQLSKLQKFIWPAIFSLLASGFAYMYVTADPPGYCRAQQRYIPDEEFIPISLAIWDRDIREHKPRWDRDPKLFESQLKAYERGERNRKHGGFIAIDRSDTHTVFRVLFDYQQIRVVLNANSGDEQRSFFYDVCGALKKNPSITTTNYLQIINQK
ncbi:MAG: hypothetical protein ABL911_00975 [Gallionella sp.]|nr:hypothetical protein [Gallionella sp.]